MSKENVKKFYQAVASDEGLRTRLSEINRQYQGEATDVEKKAAFVEKMIIPVAAEKGFSFTIEELKQYEAELSQSKENDELSSEELEAVAGGLVFGGIFCLVLGAGVVIGTGACTGLGFVW